MTGKSRSRNTHYNQTGHAHFVTFSTYRNLPLLTNDAWRSELAAQLRQTLNDHRIALWAYVFMPNHVHMLVKPRLSKYDMSKFLQDVKWNVARQLLEHLRRIDAPLLENLRVSERSSQTSHRVWQKGGGHDFNVFTKEKATEKATYCHNNPVRAGLVKHPGQWRWSSYRWLMMNEREGAPLRIDDWDWSLVDG